MIRRVALSVLFLALIAGVGAQSPVTVIPHRDDGDGNRIADVLDAQIASIRASDMPPAQQAAALRDSVPVELHFAAPIRDGHRTAVRHRGATILREDSTLAHALVAELPIGSIEPLARDLSGLLLIAPIDQMGVRITFFGEGGTKRWISRRDAEGLEALARRGTLVGPGIAVIDQEGGSAATSQARAATLARRGFVVLSHENATELRQPLEEQLAMALAAPEGDMLRAEWSEEDAVARFHAILAIALRYAPDAADAVAHALEAFTKVLEIPASLQLSPDVPHVVVIPPTEAAASLHVEAARGTEAQLMRYAIEPSLLYDPEQAEELESHQVTTGSDFDLLPHALETVLVMTGSGEVRLLHREEESESEPAELVVADDVPTTAPALVHEPPPADGPHSLAPYPWSGPRPQIDGRAEGYAPPAIVNPSRSESSLLQVANLRLAHDNDYLYVHVAANLPATAERPPAALWIIWDSDRQTGVNPLTDNGMMGPLAATQGMKGTVLEPWFEADSMLFLENATSGRRTRYRLWWIDYAGERALQLAEFGVTTPGAGALSPDAPVGFLAGFDNSGGFLVPGEAERAASGLELRIPLSMAGLDAPLYPRLARQEWRVMVGAGHGETGAWSNQVLGPVRGVESLGGGAGRLQPDFRRNRTGEGSAQETFVGVQTLSYFVEYVPRDDSRP